MPLTTIGTAAIDDNAITAAKIAPDTVVAADIAANAITASELADDAVDTNAVADSAVATAKLADNAVTLAKMAGLARGKIIIGDASGDPAALTVGSNGQSLVSNGTDISWGAGGITWQAVSTSAATMVAGRGYFVNTSSAAFSMTLPLSATIGDEVHVIDYAGTFDTNNFL